MLLVISPAKKLDECSPLPQSLTATQPALLDDAAQLIDQLKPLAPHQVAALMKLSDALGTLNYERFQQWHLPFDNPNARPAVLTFAGDVYQGLDAQSFSDADFKFAQQHLRILSGLYGVLRPLDLMQAYRLEMGTAFANNRGANLYAFWGQKVTELLNAQLAQLGSNTLVNLASTEYFKVVKPKQLNATVIEPVFKDYKNGDYKIISFFAKKARGLMSAYSIKNKLTKPDDLKAFDSEGYAYNSAMSNDIQWVFTRKL
ncbi:MAG: peroxide stress protein YaaA [Marinagarivorans sp.]|nr:peroxide stress protein YaaA [Marinagarivorans sp.]